MKPRQIIAGATYIITRRTTQQLFLLRPSAAINGAIRYCLGLAQRRSKVKIHAIIFMSNHYHIVVTDVDGKLPIFTEELHKLIARCLNCKHERWENFWAGAAQTSHVELATREAILEKIVYTLANPTEALLVSHGPEWPGVRLFRKGKYKVSKPTFFFRTKDEGGTLPQSLKLVLSAPDIGVHEKRADDVVQRAVTAREKVLREQAYAEGKTFLGAAKVKAQKIYHSSSGSTPHRGLSPQVAARDKWRRIEVLARNADFVKEHAERRKEFVAGKRDVVFPAGTYRLVKQFGARCAEA